MTRHTHTWGENNRLSVGTAGESGQTGRERDSYIKRESVKSFN